MKKEYITLEEFSKSCGIKESTIKKRIENIPGVEYVNRKYRVLQGTRYPMNKSHIGKKTRGSRTFAMLMSLDKDLYVDENCLDLSEQDLRDIISSLSKYNFIEQRTSNNHYGLNDWNITPIGLQHLYNMQFIKDLKTQKTLLNICSLLAMLHIY